MIKCTNVLRRPETGLVSLPRRPGLGDLIRDIPSRHISSSDDEFGRNWDKFTKSDAESIFEGSNPMNPKPAEFNDAVYEATAEVTLEYISDYMDELVDSNSEVAQNFDVVLSQGVLTVKCGSHGTFVINKQGPNKQIWFSSPFSGPKRYDWDFESSEWRYRDATLTSLLTEEFQPIFGDHVDFYFLNHKIMAFAHEAYGADDY